MPQPRSAPSSASHLDACPAAEVPAYPEVPSCLITVPTFRCPLRCAHCDLWRLRRKEIPAQLWRRRITELAAQVSRPFLVGISGGEPLVYGGIYELVEACAERELRTALATSSLPLNDRRTRRLLAAGVTSLVLPLDGMGLNHDELRGRPGLLARTEGAITRVRAHSPRLNLTVVTTVTRRNVEQLVSMAHWVYGQPERLDGVCFHTLSGNLGSEAEADPDWHRSSPLWPGDHPLLAPQLEQLACLRAEGLPMVNSPEELRSMLRFYQRPDRQLRPCDQYASGLLALPDGAVKLCPLHDPVGDLNQSSLLEIWHGDRARQLRRRMVNCTRNCHFMTNFAYQRHEIAPDARR